jgi:hypothetical protein
MVMALKLFQLIKKNSSGLTQAPLNERGLGGSSMSGTRSFLVNAA